MGWDIACQVWKIRGLAASLGDACVAVWDIHAHVSVSDSVLYGLRTIHIAVDVDLR